MKFKATIIKAFDNNLKFASDNEDEQYERIIESGSLKSAAFRFCSLAGVDYFLSRPETSQTYICLNLCFQNGVTCKDKLNTTRCDGWLLKNQCNENISSADDYVVVELFESIFNEEKKSIYRLEKIKEK